MILLPLGICLKRNHRILKTCFTLTIQQHRLVNNYCWNLKIHSKKNQCYKSNYCIMSFQKLIKKLLRTNNNKLYLLNSISLRVLCCSVCLFLYRPFCHGELDISTLDLYTRYIIYTV